jgi:hypothetical protein
MRQFLNVWAAAHGAAAHAAHAAAAPLRFTFLRGIFGL